MTEETTVRGLLNWLLDLTFVEIGKACLLAAVSYFVATLIVAWIEKDKK